MATTSTRKLARHSDIDLTEDWAKIKNAFADTAIDIRGKTGEMISQSLDGVKDKSNQLRDGLTTYTADHPVKSIGIALLVGATFGYFMHRK